MISELDLAKLKYSRILIDQDNALNGANSHGGNLSLREKMEIANKFSNLLKAQLIILKNMGEITFDSVLNTTVQISEDAKQLQTIALAEMNRLEVTAMLSISMRTDNADVATVILVTDAKYININIEILNRILGSANMSVSMAQQLHTESQTLASIKDTHEAQQYLAKFKPSSIIKNNDNDHPMLK
jgi:hypothetical protein